MRLSRYNLHYPLTNGRYLLLNGCTGAVDEVDAKVNEILSNAKENISLEQALDKDVLNNLINRGYITSLTEEEELYALKKIAVMYQKINNKLLQVTIIPTYNCNFRCPYCYELKLHNKGKEWMSKTMSLDTVDNIFEYLDSMRDTGREIGEINLYGGEPLLKNNRPVIEKIVENCQSKDYKVMAISNGYEIEHYNDLLGPQGIREVQITLDGIGELHNKRRKHMDGNPTYERTLEIVNYLLDNDVIVSLRTNIDHENIKSISALNNLFKELGWSNNPKFRNYFKAVHGCYSKDSHPINDEDILKELLKEDKEKEKKSASLSGVAADIAGRFKYILETGDYALFKATYCGAVNGMLVFDPFSNIYPCWDTVGDESHIIGKVSDKGVYLNERYDHWQGRQPQNIIACQKCPYILYCGGGCPAHAKVVDGSIYKPYCDKYKEIFDKTIPAVYEEYLKTI